MTFECGSPRQPAVSSRPPTSRSPASVEPAVDGADVPITINGRPGMFVLNGADGRYRIVDPIADPRMPVVFPAFVAAA